MVRVGQKFRRTEPVHEFLVDVEFQVDDAVADAVHFFQAIACSQRQGGAAQGAVA